MNTNIKKLLLTTFMALSAVWFSSAQTDYKKTVRTEGEAVSITDCAVNVRPYDSEKLQKTRILAKNGVEFAITFPESYQNLSIIRNNRRVEIQGRKVISKEPGPLGFGYTYTENGVSYICDVIGDVNYYGELEYEGRTNLRDNPIVVTNANKNDYLTIPQAFAGLEWLLYRNVFDSDQKTIDYDKLAECQNTAFSRKRVISFEELLTLKSDQIVGGKLELLLLLQDHTSNALSNGVPGGTSLQAITLVDARTYKVNLSQQGQGTVSVAKNEFRTGEAVALTAQAAQGWQFSHWEENGQHIGTANPLTFTMEAQHRTIKAVFIQIPKYTVTLQIVDTKGGILARSQQQRVQSGGSTTFQVPNLPNTNFKGWYRNGQLVGTGNTYSLSNITQDETIQAVFEIPVQTVALSFTELSLKVGERGELPTATVTPNNASDKSIRWASDNEAVAKIEDGSVVGVRSGTTQLIASSVNGKTAALQVVVSEVQKYTITLQIVDIKGTILARSQQQRVQSGGSTSFQVPNLPNTNFKGWYHNGQLVGTGNTYSLSNITQDETIQAVFEIPVQTVALSFTELSLKVGERGELPTATVTPNNASDKSISWASDNEAIAKIEDGSVVGVRSGTTQLIASSVNGKTAALQVVVSEVQQPQQPQQPQEPQQPQQPQVIPVQSVTVTPASITAKVGDVPVQLTATVLPANATTPTVSWLSANEQVVKVDSNGRVTIIAAGETTIEAKAGEKTFTVQVKVEAAPQQPQQPQVIPVQSVTVTPASITAKVGDAPIQLTATVLPANATSPTVSWKSNNEQVVKVDSNGRVTIIAAGETTIEAKAGEKTFTVQVKVAAAPQQPQQPQVIPVQSVTVTPASITAKVGDAPIQLTATVLPANATSPTVSWKSNNEQVVKVDSNGKVTIIAAGETTIEAKAGEKTFTVQVKVEAAPQQPQQPQVIPVQSVTVTPASITAKVGDAPIQLTATVLPANATSPTVSWKSNNEQVVKVDSNGKVTIIAAGETTIEAKAGEKTFTVQVKVAAQVPLTPPAEEFPPYIKDFPTEITQGMAINIGQWEFLGNINASQIRYHFTDADGKVLGVAPATLQANSLTFTQSGNFVLVATLPTNTAGWTEVRFSITVKIKN